MTTKIYIELRKLDRYRVTLEDGTLLVRATRVPFYAGARALEVRGVSGPFEMWDRVRPFPRAAGDIATAAKLTVTEKQGRLEVVPYQAFPEDRERLKVASNKKLALG
jgi:hypothetical protein